jgi:hypothetical protein
MIHTVKLFLRELFPFSDLGFQVLENGFGFIGVIWIRWQNGEDFIAVID